MKCLRKMNACTSCVEFCLDSRQFLLHVLSKCLQAKSYYISYAISNIANDKSSYEGNWVVTSSKIPSVGKPFLFFIFLVCGSFVSSDFSGRDKSVLSSSTLPFFHILNPHVFFTVFPLSLLLSSFSSLWKIAINGFLFPFSLLQSCLSDSGTLSIKKIDLDSLQPAFQKGFSVDLKSSFPFWSLFLRSDSLVFLSSFNFPYWLGDTKSKTEEAPFALFDADLTKHFSSFKSITDHSSFEICFCTPRTVTSVSLISAPWTASLCNKGLFEAWYSSSDMQLA